MMMMTIYNKMIYIWRGCWFELLKYENFNGENTVKILIMSKTTWPRSAAFLSFAYLFGSKSSPTYVWLHIIIITIKVIIMSICIFSQRHYSQSFHHQEYHRWNYLITKLLVSVKVISLIRLILGAFILSNGKSWLLWDYQLKHRGCLLRPPEKMICWKTSKLALTLSTFGKS